MTRHIYIDETKAKSYVLVAVTMPSEALAESRRVVGGLVQRGQRSLHTHDESAGRKRQIMAALAELADAGVVATVLDGGSGPEVPLRRWCLRTLCGGLGTGPSRLTLDLDETRRADDERVLIGALRTGGAYGRVGFEHFSTAQEPLLAIPDAVGWCWARGGAWSRLAMPLIHDVVTRG